MTALLATRGLTAGHEGTAVVHGLDLEVRAGDVVALLGPNGAGKSTTLWTIAGVLPAVAGHVEVLGSPGGDAPHRIARRGLALVPDDRGLFHQLTVAENLRLHRRAGRRDRELERLGMGLFPALVELSDRKVGLLSGGEQQMLALACALAAQPRVLMIDEMSLGLAPIVVSRLLGIVRQLATDTGLGVLLVEQHVHAALQVADHAHVLSRGRVTYEGSAAQLAADPELLEASYLGSRE